MLKKRKELWEIRESGNSVPSLGGRGHKAFASETEAATGLTKRAINKDLRRASRIAPDVMEEVKGTEMDKGVDLDAWRSPRAREEERRNLPA